MIDKIIKQSPIFGEFSPEEADRYFSLSKEKVTAHVDTFYYSVSVQNDSNDCSGDMQTLLHDLANLRLQKSFNDSAPVDFYGLSVEKTRFVHYEFCLRLNEQFDIFISSILPNDHTPRIIVQLRSRLLVLDGVCKAICKSFRYVEDILNAYGLKVCEVNENRIDYAYHSNLIQNPYKFFKDETLLKKLKSKLRICNKVIELNKNINIDYLSFGHRKSNDIFVRIYNKSREVIDKNYKSFFIDKWYEDKLISEYDRYCYTRAFEIGSYVTGLLAARIEWYLEHGKNDDIKKELSEVNISSYVNSDNTDQLRKIVDKYLPPVTLITNVEFQTKRRFYCSMNEWINSYSVGTYKENGILHFYERGVLPLARLFVIFSLRSEICNYLTKDSFCFVENKGEKNEKLCHWWKRINQCYIEEYEKRVIDLWRSHEQHTNLEKTKRRACGTIASASILNSGCFKDSTFLEDVSDVLCTLNDNDFYGFAANPETGEVPEIEPKYYQHLKKRKYRQCRPILSKEKEELRKDRKEKEKNESMCNECKQS